MLLLSKTPLPDFFLTFHAQAHKELLALSAASSLKLDNGLLSSL